MLTCNHGKKGNSYRCKEITTADQKYLFNKFYNPSVKTNELKIKQDSYILKYTDATKPKRSRLVNYDRGEKSMVVKYYFYKNSKKEKIPVCQKAFIETLRLSKNRVKGVVHRHFISGQMPTENRDGERRVKSYSVKKQAVIDFIKKN